MNSSPRIGSSVTPTSFHFGADGPGGGARSWVAASNAIATAVSRFPEVPEDAAGAANGRGRRSPNTSLSRASPMTSDAT